MRADPGLSVPTPASRTDLAEQVEAREGLKKILVGLGGSQEAGPVSLNRKWAGRKGKRSASPPRLPSSKVGKSGLRLA
jgi:hypothetical protein